MESIRRDHDGHVILEFGADPLRPWIEDVRLHWELEWRDKEPIGGELHRYTKDFASFVGERFLTDFGFRNDPQER